MREPLVRGTVSSEYRPLTLDGERELKVLRLVPWVARPALSRAARLLGLILARLFDFLFGEFYFHFDPPQRLDLEGGLHHQLFVLL